MRTDGIFAQTEPDGAMNSLMNRNTSLFNYHFPYTHKRKVNHTNAWFTNNLKKLQRQKDKLYKKYSQTKSQINKQKYTTARNLYFHKVCEAKRKYIKVLFVKK